MGASAALCLVALSTIFLTEARSLYDHDPPVKTIAAAAGEPALFGVGNATWVGTPKIISWHPMATLYEGFLSMEECDYLLNLAKPQMEPAMLVNSNEQKHIRSKSRTSHGAFFDSFENEVLAMITNRIAHVAKVPPENVEPWQVMQYGPSEKYTRHVDYYDRDERFFGNNVEKFGGQRIKTALLYLTDAVGGETVFPRSLQNNPAGVDSCAGKGAGVTCKKGNMLVFHNIHPDGSLDGSSSHQSCPVKQGEKVVVSRFIRQEACHLNKYFSKRKWNGNVFCEDDHNKCKEWAALGHCTSSNPRLRERMIGDEDWTGFCEKTCGVCRPLEDTVVEMRRQVGQEVTSEAINGYFFKDWGGDMGEIYA